MTRTYAKPFVVETALDLQQIENAIRYYQTMDNMLQLGTVERRLLVRNLWADRDHLHGLLQQLLKPAVDTYLAGEREKTQAEHTRAQIAAGREAEVRRLTTQLDIQTRRAERMDNLAAEIAKPNKAAVKRKKKS